MTTACVLFDFDDTIVPTFPIRARALEATVRAVLGRDLDGAAFFRAHLGEPLEQSGLRLAGGDPALAETLVRDYRDRYYAATAAGLTCFAGIPATLARLRAAGVRVAVVTSKIHWGAEQELKGCGLAGYVELLVGSDDVPAHKPSPVPLRHAMAALGVPPAATLMVGDSDADMLAAHAAGTASAAALWGAQDHARLLAARPTHRLTAVSDLLAVLGF